MSDVELIIKIPENEYNIIKKFNAPMSWVERLIANGTPLDEVLNKIRSEMEAKCDRINNLASVLPYTAHREIQGLLCEIMDLCKESEEV